MYLSSSDVSATVRMLGETEASSAGEQLAKGYPSRAMTNRRQGRPSGLPVPFPHPSLTVHAFKNSRPKSGTSGKLGPHKKWPEFPEKCGHIFRNPHRTASCIRVFHGKQVPTRKGSSVTGIASGHTSTLRGPSSRHCRCWAKGRSLDSKPE